MCAVFFSAKLGWAPLLLLAEHGSCRSAEMQLCRMFSSHRIFNIFHALNCETANFVQAHPDTLMKHRVLRCGSAMM